MGFKYAKERVALQSEAARTKRQPVKRRRIIFSLSHWNPDHGQAPSRRDSSRSCPIHASWTTVGMPRWMVGLLYGWAAVWLGRFARNLTR